MSQDKKPTSKNANSVRQRRRVSISFEGTVPRTHQSFKDECDINQIVRKSQANGRLPDLIKTNPKYGDFSEPLTYQESLNVVIHANDQFANLTAQTRKKFNNDPAQFLEFAANPENLPEMVKLGLATKRENNDDSNDANLTSPEPKNTPKNNKKGAAETPPEKT